jgi:hypothetical protein
VLVRTKRSAHALFLLSDHNPRETTAHLFGSLFKFKLKWAGGSTSRRTRSIVQTIYKYRVVEKFRSGQVMDKHEPDIAVYMARFDKHHQQMSGMHSTIHA